MDLPPAAVDALAAHWSLDVGPPFEPAGQTAWVAPATSPTYGDVVLKLAFRHDEAVHEADGLRLWAGDGAIHVHDTLELEEATALLLERCRPGSSLRERPELEQDHVIGGLLQRLWQVRTPDHPFRPLRTMCDMWADQFEAKVATGEATIDPGLARSGIALFRGLPDTAERRVLLCTDLHAGNVLRAEREPWLMIDPKPYVGDPTYDALQHVLNCEDRLVAAPHDLARRVAECCGLDPERLLLWLFARCVQQSPDWPHLADVARRLAP